VRKITGKNQEGKLQVKTKRGKSQVKTKRGKPQVKPLRTWDMAARIVFRILACLT